jgi:hypothetical protein
MNSKPAIAILLLAILAFSLVGQTFGATRMTGVYEQDYFVYTMGALWAPKNPNVAVPADLLEINQTVYYNVTIVAISGANVSADNTWHFANGTDTQANVLQDVDSGNLILMKGLVEMVGVDLKVNDSLYQSATDLRRINQTLIIDYGDNNRETNAVYVSYPLTDSSGTVTGYGNSAYYYDKQTGMMVGRSDNTFEATGNASVTILLEHTNRWAITAAPTVVEQQTSPPYTLVAIIATIIVVAIVVAVLFLRNRKGRRKRHRR